MLHNITETHPQLAKEWHPTKNKQLSPQEFSKGSSIKVWWLCAKGHEWEAIINSRNGGRGCPYCKNRKAGYGNDLKTLYPKVAKEWHSEKNGDLKPQNFTYGAKKNVWWICKFGHEWKAVIYNRTKGTKCPYCTNHKVGYGNDLETKYPNIAKEWHPNRNRDLKPSKILPGSGIKVWWKCSKGHEWATAPNQRTAKNGTGCPKCH